MAVEPGCADYRDRLFFGVEHDPMLVDVELKGAAVRPRLGERRERAEERRQSFLRQREPVPVTAFMRSLDLLIGQPRRRAHQPTFKPMSSFAAGGVDP